MENKEKLCFRKYKNNSILFGALFLAALCMCVLLTLADVMNGGAYLGCFLLLLISGLLVVYYLYCYFYYKKKAKDMTTSIGTITNWKLSGRRSRWSCVVIKHQDNEYCSPNYFTSSEAEAMVGKEVSYIIIDDTLLIYDILN